MAGARTAHYANVAAGQWRALGADVGNSARPARERGATGAATPVSLDPRALSYGVNRDRRAALSLHPYGILAYHWRRHFFANPDCRRFASLVAIVRARFCSQRGGSIPR